MAQKEVEKLFFKGIGLLEKGDFRKALEVFMEYNEIWDGNHVVHFDMGVCHYNMGDTRAAKACMEKALKINPDYKRARDALFDISLRQMEGKMVKKSKKNEAGKILQFYITLNGAEPKIWRRIEVEENTGLRTFAVSIILAMGWKNSHLHEFIIAGKHYGLTGDDFDSIDESMVPQDETKFRLKDFRRVQLKKFKFMYDFGDGWKHDVSLEHAHEPEAGAFYPRCIAGGRNCPPEDCGGIGGYEDLVEKLKDQGNEEYEGLIQWLGGKYDPEFFNAELVSREMSKTDAYEMYGFEGDKSAGEIVLENDYKNCGIGTTEDLQTMKKREGRIN